MRWGSRGAISEGIIPTTPTPMKKRRVRILGQLPELSASSNSEFFEYGLKEKDEANTENDESNGMKHVY